MNLQHQREKMLIRVNAHIGEEIVLVLGTMSEEDFLEIYTPAKTKYDELVAEHNRKIQEQQQEAERKKALESSSDKEKLVAMVDAISITTVTTTTEEGLLVQAELVKKLDAYKIWAKKLINESW